MRWTVYREYALVEFHVISTDGAIRREYDPFADRGGKGTRLLTQFAGIRDDKALLRFVWYWGLLQEGGREPLPWLQAHVRQVGLVLELAKRLQDGDNLRPVLDAHGYDGATLTLPMVGAEPYLWNIEYFSVDAIRQRSKKITAQQTFRGTPDEVARRIIATAINSNLSGTGYRLDPDTLRPQLEAEDLRGALYVRLQDVVAGGQLVLCKNPNCQRVFVRRHKRQRFCPPTGEAKTSQCGDTYRKRKERGG